MTGLQEQVEQDIRRQRLFRRGQSAVVAVSGGADSMVLLHLLHGLAPSWGWRLRVAHVNHQLRGRSSLADERLVVRVCEELGLPWTVERVDVVGLMKREGLSMEMAARRLRHEFLARTALGAGCRTIAVAHHADDQVEQFFLRLLRGSGPDGLGGFKWKNRSAFKKGIRLVRPLLGLSRAQIRSYATEARVRFREDLTNLEPVTPRSRIRHQLLPALRENHQPALNSVILRQMEILSADAACLTEEAENWLKRPGARSFENLPLALQRRCILIQLHEAGIPAEFDLVERLRLNPDRPQTIGPGRSVVRPRDGRLRVGAPEAPAAFRGGAADVVLRGTRGTAAFGGLRVQWKLHSGPGLAPRLRVGECFDADRVGERISLRHWLPGDRFRPIGMSTSVKLQDWFTNLKIPRTRRHQLVLAVTGTGEIWWVEGLRIGENFKVTQTTRRRLSWCWTR